MRYTAATCDPAEFIEKQYELRQTLFTKKRSTELMIVITMYNEDDLLFARTLAGVFENIEYMCNGKAKYGGSLGKEGWKSIVVCVVSDGRAKLNPRTKAVMTALGVYQEDIGTEALNGKSVTAHIYEYTTQVGITVNKKTEIVETRPGMSIPVQMIFCLKEEIKESSTLTDGLFKPLVRDYRDQILLFFWMPGPGLGKPASTNSIERSCWIRTVAELAERSKPCLEGECRWHSRTQSSRAKTLSTNEQSAGQAYGVRLRIYFRPSRSVLSIQIHCFTKQQRRGGPLGEVFRGRV